jgi:hypothetical protein
MMTLKVLLLFIREAVNSVIDSKDILWIKRLLHLSHKIYGWVWQNALNESLTNFSNTMMMG